MPIDNIAIELEMFASRSRLACCGTCEAWREQCPPHSRKSYPYCSRISRFLLGRDLTAIGCQLWRREKYESYAVDLWADPVREGAK